MKSASAPFGVNGLSDSIVQPSVFTYSKLCCSADLPLFSELEIVWRSGFVCYVLEGFAAAAERWMAFHGGIVSVKGC
jgi:hypothetical protein